MRLPAYLLLPIGGAVLLLAAVLGTWLWPEPAVSVSNGPAPAALAPAAVEAPPLPPPSTARPSPSAPVQPLVPSPSPAAMPVAPAASPSRPPPPAHEPMLGYTPAAGNMTREQQAEMKRKYLTLGSRTLELAERGAKELERQRDEAHARGDVAEVNRLNEILGKHAERMERARQQRSELAPAQAGPPSE